MDIEDRIRELEERVTIIETRGHTCLKATDILEITVELKKFKNDFSVLFDYYRKLSQENKDLSTKIDTFFEKINNMVINIEKRLNEWKDYNDRLADKIDKYHEENHENREQFQIEFNKHTRQMWRQVWVVVSGIAAAISIFLYAIFDKSKYYYTTTNHMLTTSDSLRNIKIEAVNKTIEQLTREILLIKKDIEK